MGANRMTHQPGAIRDSIVDYLRTIGSAATLEEISQGVTNMIGQTSPSSIRSSLNLHVGTTIERIGRGRYRLKALTGHVHGHVNGDASGNINTQAITLEPAVIAEKARLFHADCF